MCPHVGNKVNMYLKGFCLYISIKASALSSLVKV